MSKREDNKKEFWITPPGLYQQLDQEFHFDFDPCPYPFNGIDGTEIEWDGSSVYLNPPFRKKDGKFNKGPTAFIRKAIEENKKGKTIVVIINTNAFINMLIEAGAEMRSLGRVKWHDAKTGEPWKSPSNTTLFILHKKTKGQEAPGVKTPQGKGVGFSDLLAADHCFLRELLITRQINKNYRESMARQSGKPTMEDIFVPNVLRTKYESLIDLAIETLRSRLSREQDNMLKQNNHHQYVDLY